jgi:hypothetical protein
MLHDYPRMLAYFEGYVWPDRRRWALCFRRCQLTLSMSASSRVESAFGAIKRRLKKHKEGIVTLIHILLDVNDLWDCRDHEDRVRCTF